MTMKERPKSRWEIADEAAAAFAFWLLVIFLSLVAAAWWFI